jgi:UDP-N-acetylmuramoylalanine--D-glutamate ligase
VGAPLDFAVLELSSFQLQTIDRFRPHVAVILNLSPDHLDRHGDFASYVEVKRRLLLQQRSDDIAVLNLDDPVVRELASSVKGETLHFARNSPVDRGVGFDAGCAVVRDEKGTLRLPLEAFPLPGAHNLENVLAALAATCAAGADPRRAISALVGFRGLPHRMEMVGEHGGVRFVNDSKATNAAAAIRSLESFGSPIVWIAGGRDKDLDLGSLAEAAARNVRQVLLIGEAAAKLERSLRERIPVEHAASLDKAVQRAFSLARTGDVVLLSPACASFDQFASFEERGECFRTAVQRLVEGRTRS